MRNLYYISLFFVIAFPSCIRNVDESERVKENSEKTQPEPIHEKIYYLFPSPEEFLEIIQESGIQYKQDLLNPVYGHKNYNTQTAVELNMGIYIADMAYCGLFQEQEEVKNYLEVLSAMSRNIYLSSSLKLKLKNLTRRDHLLMDSVNQLSNKLFYEVVDDLEATQQNKAVSIICAGAYIESLYLSLNSVQSYSENKNLTRRLGEQQFAFRNMVAYMRQNSSDSDVAALIEKLKKIESLYQSMKYSQEAINTVVSSDSEIRVTGGKVYYLDEQTFYLLLDEVGKIREDFIQMK